MNRLEQIHALVTGAEGGIGLAVTRGFLEAGAWVTATDRGAQPGADIATLLAEYPDALVYRSMDVSNTAAVRQQVRDLNRERGLIRVLFNNAAVFDMAPLLESDEASFDRLFDINVRGLFFTMQAVLAELVACGERGSVINLASQAGRRGEALVSHYCATKAAVISYTQSAALAMAAHGIRVNAIAPGVIDTPMWKHVDALFARYEGLQPGEKKIAVGKAVPLGYMGQPDDLIGAAVFLASEASAYITGQTLNVDGGNVLS